MSLLLKKYIESWRRLENMSEVERKAMLQNNPGIIVVFFGEPIFKYWTNPLKTSAAPNLLYTLGEFSIDIYETEKAIAKKFLSDSVPEKLLCEKTMKVAFAPLLEKLTDNDILVRGLLERLIEEQSKLEAANLAVLDALFKILSCKESLGVEISEIISALSQSIAFMEAIETDVVFSSEIFERNLFYFVYRKIMANKRDEEKSVEQLAYDIFDLTQEVLAKTVVYSEALNDQLKAWLDYELYLMVKQNPEIIEERFGKGVVTLSVALAKYWYHWTGEFYQRLWMKPPIPGYEGEMPDRIKDRRQFVNWCKRQRRVITQRMNFFVNAEQVTEQIIHKLLGHIKHSDLAQMVLPFLHKDLSGLEAFKFKVKGYLEEKVQGFDPKVAVTKPSFPLVSEKTLERIARLKTLLIEKTWKQGDHGVKGVVFEAEDIPKNTQLAIKKSLRCKMEKKMGVDCDFREHIVFAFKLQKSIYDDVRDVAKQFIGHLPLDRMRDLKIMVDEAKSSGLARSLEILCELAIKKKGYVLNKLVLFFQHEVDKKFYKRLLDQATFAEKKALLSLKDKDGYTLMQFGHLAGSAHLIKQLLSDQDIQKIDNFKEGEKKVEQAAVKEFRRALQTFEPVVSNIDRISQDESVRQQLAFFN